MTASLGAGSVVVNAGLVGEEVLINIKAGLNRSVSIDLRLNINYYWIRILIIIKCSS